MGNSTTESLITHNATWKSNHLFNRFPCNHTIWGSLDINGREHVFQKFLHLTDIEIVGLNQPSKTCSERHIDCDGDLVIATNVEYWHVSPLAAGLRKHLGTKKKPTGISESDTYKSF